ncbi:MAG: tetratricopeptide repeat protein [Deltaproteobacteria bacterium]
MKNPKDRSVHRMVAPAVLLISLMGILPCGTGQIDLSTAAQQESRVPAVKAPEIVTTESKEEIPDWLARWELARVLSYVKKYDESVMEYKKLIREKPSLVEAKIEMANVMYWQGKMSDALKELEAIPVRAMTDKTRVLMADLYVHQKKYDLAESLYRSYLDKNRDDLKVRLKLAETLSWSRKYDDSLAEYEKILSVKPSDAQVRRKYAFVLIWAGRHSDAARELRSTLK